VEGEWQNGGKMLQGHKDLKVYQLAYIKEYVIEKTYFSENLP
jgi:hypothetical protein